MVPTGEPKNERGIPVHVKAGISYGVERFLEWDGWSPTAQRFLKYRGIRNLHYGRFLSLIGK